MTDQSEPALTEPSEPHMIARYDNLSPVDRVLAGVALSPRWIVYFFIALAVLLAWIWLSFLAAGASSLEGAGKLGPGMSVWQGWLAELSTSAGDNTFIAFLLKICAPASPNGFGIAVFMTTVSMWMLMSLAMMLPSAAPMFRTYGDIADVAADKSEPVVPLVVLVAGYLAVWLGFSVVISVVQLALMWLGIIADPVFPLRGLMAGLILIGAGAYQFSELKNACLEKCRNPFSILFGKWTSRPVGVFKLGVEQGMFCLGCCWALMLVMLVVGTMNLAWMAFFTLFAIVEKSGKGKVTSQLSGGILIIWGGILSIASAISI